MIHQLRSIMQDITVSWAQSLSKTLRHISSLCNSEQTDDGPEDFDFDVAQYVFSLPLGGNEISIYVYAPGHKKFWGFYDYRRRAIYVEHQLEPAVFLYVLFHEYRHAYADWFQHTFKSDDTEESECDSFAEIAVALLGARCEDLVAQYDAISLHTSPETPSPLTPVAHPPDHGS